MPVFVPVQPPRDPAECSSWLYEAVTRLNRAAFRSSQGFAAIIRGEAPDGSGLPLGLDDYLYLPGRQGGQTLLAVDSYPAFRILTNGLSLQRWEKTGVPPLDLIAIDNGGAAWDYGIVTTEVGSGFQINVNGGASGIRFTSGVSPNLRGYIEAGTTAGGNLNLALTGFNGANGTSIWSGFSYHAFVTMVDEDTLAYNTRVGVNRDPYQYSSSAAASQPDALIVARRAGATSTVPTTIIEGAGDTEAALSIRSASSSGTSPVENNRDRTIGATNYLSLLHNGTISWGATKITQASTSGTLGRLQMTNSSSRNVLDVRASVAAWSDFADPTNVTGILLGNSTDDNGGAIFARDAGGVLPRLGFCVTSIVLGPRSTGALPEPLSGRLITLVNSSGTVLSGFDSAGAHFHVSGAGAGKVWTSDANGVGSWGSGVTNEYADDVFRIYDNSDNTKKIAFEASGISTGTTRTLTVPNLSGTLALIDQDQTWSGTPTMGGSDGNGVSIILGDGTALGVPQFLISSVGGGLPNLIWAYVFDTDAFSLGAPTTGLFLTVDGALSGSFPNLIFPAAGGTVVTTLAAQTLQVKTIANQCKIRTGNTFSGAVFQDAVTTTKQFYFDATLIPASTTRKVFINDKVDSVLVGRVDETVLTGQTGNISATTLYATASTTPGMYQVDIYLRTTTAGTGGNTLAVNLLWTAGGVAQNEQVIATHDLDNTDAAGDGVTGLSRYSTVIYGDTSTNIQFSTTLTAASGSPVYTIVIVVRAI